MAATTDGSWIRENESGVPESCFCFPSISPAPVPRRRLHTEELSLKLPLLFLLHASFHHRNCPKLQPTSPHLHNQETQQPQHIKQSLSFIIFLFHSPKHSSSVPLLLPKIMAEEKHHHHGLFHHKDEEKPVDNVYSETDVAYSGGQYSETTEVIAVTTEPDQVDYEKEKKHHKHLEEVGKLGAAAAGAYALYEKHEAKKDPEHGHRHKIEEEVAAAAAVGAGGFAFHERHEKKEAKEEEEEAHGKKHHHLFG